MHRWLRRENPGTEQNNGSKDKNDSRDNNDDCKTGGYDRTPASAGKRFGKGFEKHFVKSLGKSFEIEIDKSCGIRLGKRFGKISEKDFSEGFAKVLGYGRFKEERKHYWG